MDIRHFDPAEAAEVTQDVGEDRPEKNKLYRVGDRVYKATSHWLDNIAALAGQRRVEITVSLCDDDGQAVKDETGAITVSAPMVLVVSAGLAKTADEQIDEGTRRWVVAFHHMTAFWDFEARGVAVKPEPPAVATSAAEPEVSVSALDGRGERPEPPPEADPQAEADAPPPAN